MRESKHHKTSTGELDHALQVARLIFDFLFSGNSADALPFANEYLRSSSAAYLEWLRKRRQLEQCRQLGCRCGGWRFAHFRHFQRAAIAE